MAQMSTKQRTTKHSKNAALLSIIPGLGQIYNKQVIKGIMFLVFFLAFGFVFKDLFNMGYWGIFTLGVEAVSYTHLDVYKRQPLISYEDVFSCETLSSSVIEKVKSESHTRLYLSAMNILKTLESNLKNDDNISENYINRFIEFLKLYPVDLMVGIMKDIKSNYINIYSKAIENEEFVELYFESYSMIRG